MGQGSSEALAHEVRVERDGHVARVILDRPESLNGLTPEVCAALAQAFRDVSADTAVRVVVLTGAGKAFCAGLDLKAAAKVLMAGQGGLSERERALREDFHGLVRALHATPQPIVARIAGAAVGFGFDIALACDVRYGVRAAKYGPVFTRIGLVPDGGGSWALPRLVGIGRAMELILGGGTFDGLAAAQYGILNEVFDSVEELDDAVERLVEHWAALPPLALREAKALVKAAAQGGGLDEALEREAAAQLRQLATADTAAAIASFFTKKSPKYTGK